VHKEANADAHDITDDCKRSLELFGEDLHWEQLFELAKMQ